MNTEQARALVAETFPKAFDKVRFHQFARELLNGFNEDKAGTMAVPDAFAPHVRSCMRLGTYESPDRELADVLIVNTTEAWKLERTRTALRDFVAHKLKRGDSYKEAGLVAFVAPDSKSWRFSYVRMEYETKRDPKTGTIKPEERLTPARRYSYLVGVDEECHTAQSRFLALLQNTSEKPSLAQIEEAFSVEKVTKEFFAQYAALFASTQESLDEIVKKDNALRADFKAKNVSTVDFAKKLLGQIVFLYFLQKKGWLGVPKGGKWGDGPRNFMRQLADRAVREKKCLFNDVLEPLFYDTLATDRGHDAWCKNFKCRIPFLNGGLFEPLSGYDWAKTNISFSNWLFTNQERTDAGDIGSGIFDVLDRYNFTVNEAEPLEKEVAIDPEMLGKVFENLIEENRRKGLGSFYTPREIVHYMCQESLINYLDTTLNRDTAIIRRADVEALIREGEQAAHYETARKDGTVSYRRHLPKGVEKNARVLDEALKSITVCDPAIGSGAFPVGMMTEVVRARVTLTPYFNDSAERTPYHFKRHAIQNSLYGVDIDPGAVEIAKLRLWLSLVVDEVDVQQIKPLPNLDYKIVTGNSLLGVEKNLFNEKLFKQLEELKPRYFDATDRKQKENFKHEIDEIIHELTNSKVAFDFEIYFSEVFHRRGGFDVVIANPPYIDGQHIATDELKFYKQKFRSAEGKVNLFNLFIERGLEILGRKACITYIVPTPILRNSRYRAIRSLILKETQIDVIHVFNDMPFEAAVVEGVVLILRKVASVSNELRTRILFDLDFSTQRMTNQLWFESAKDNRFLITMTSEEMVLIERLKSSSVSLDSICQIRDGISTGFKPFPDLLLGRKTGSDFVCAKGDTEKFDSSVHKKVIDGGEFRKYSPIQWQGRYIKYDKRIEQNPKPPKGKPFNCQLRDKDIFESLVKIVSRQTSDRLIATLDYDRYYTRNSIHNLTVLNAMIDTRYILGLFNSRLLNFIYRKVTEEVGKVLPQVHIADLKELPIVVGDAKTQKQVAHLVEKILAAKQRDAETDTSAMEREIDELVYALYGLTQEEISIIEAAR